MCYVVFHNHVIIFGNMFIMFDYIWQSFYFILLYFVIFYYVWCHVYCILLHLEFVSFTMFDICFSTSYYVYQYIYYVYCVWYTNIYLTNFTTFDNNFTVFDIIFTIFDNNLQIYITFAIFYYIWQLCCYALKQYSSLGNKNKNMKLCQNEKHCGLKMLQENVTNKQTITK